MLPRDRLAGLLVATVLLASACSTSGTADATTGTPVATSTVNLPPSYKFDPVSITVSAGTTVTWTNHDNFSHSVQFKDGGLPTTPQLMSPGASTTFTFATAGVYHYQCSLHPQQMQGVVTVTQ